MANIWQDIIKLSVLGTIRGTFSKTSLNELGRWGIDTTKQPIGRILWQSIAMSSQFRKVGIVLTKHTDLLPEMAAEEKKPLCSSLSIKHIEEVLNINEVSLLTELIKGLAGSQKRVPAEKIPVFLDLLKAQPQLQKELLEIVGERGQWLAKQYTVWKEYIWEEGKVNDWSKMVRAERIHYLKKMRQKDPEKAITIVQSTWAEESLQDKLVFLKIFQQELSMCDEPFLETCLNDSRKEVRVQTAHLLSQLPASMLSKRMFERAKTAFQYQDEDTTVVLRLPKTVSHDMARDGIDAKLSWKGTKQSKQEENIFYQIIVASPPHYWEKEFDLSPYQILGLIIQTDKAELLLQGFLQATIHFKNTDWAIAFYKMAIKADKTDIFQNFRNEWKKIVELLPNEVFNTLAIQALRQENGVIDDASPTVMMLQNESQKWSEELSLEVVKLFHKVILKDTYIFFWGLKTVLKRAGYAAPPSVYEQVAYQWPEKAHSWRNWANDVQEFLRVLLLRREMQQEFLK